MEKEENTDHINLLMENSVALQKVLTDLTFGLKRLSTDMGQLLPIFKEATMSAGEDRAGREVEHAHKKELIEKLNTLIDQNKHIARGLILLESALRERERREFKY